MISRAPGLSALAEHAQFILVRLQPSTTRPGKTDKIPLDWRTGAAADAHDPAIWMPLAQAEVMLGAWPGHLLGFVITPATGLWCLDVDECVTLAGQWSKTALDLFALLPNAAAEVSQSGKGLHFWGKGTVPAHSTKCMPLGLELYTDKRFIALTGHVLQGNAHADCTVPIGQLVASCFAPRAVVAAPTEGPRADWRGPTDDDELLRRAMLSRGAAAAFGSKASFSDLWNANAEVLARCYPDSGDRAYDASSADAALAQHLAFWTGCDAERIERLMRRSSLVRDKWDRDDYLQHRTIHFACTHQKTVLCDAQGADDAWQSLTMLPTEQILQQWLEVARPLSRPDAEKLIQHVAHRTATPAPALRATLREAIEEVRAVKSAQEVRQQAGERVLMQHLPDSPHVQVVQVEQAILARATPGEYVSFGGVLSQVITRGPQVTIEPLNDAEVLKRMAGAVAFYKPRKGGVQELIEHPVALQRMILNQRTGSLAPKVTGVLTHPAVLPSGEVLCNPGIDPTTGLFITGGFEGFDVAPYTQVQAEAAVAWLRTVALEGFNFADRQQAANALSVIFLQMQRRVIDLAPGFAALANHQACGKTTLCRTVHTLVTGRDLPATNLPAQEGEEQEKTFISVGMTNPSAIMIDNFPEGWNVRSRTMTTAVTSPVLESRMLGSNRVVSIPTNFALYLSGNNLTFAPDEAGRWVTCHLTTRLPGGPRDVLENARTLRDQVLRHLVGILRGYILHGGHAVAVPSRFPQWDAMVRGPLLWAGEPDPAASFDVNESQGSDQQAQRTLLWAIGQVFAGRSFTVSDLVSVIQMGTEPQVVRGLRESLETLGVPRPDNLRAIGHKLSQMVRRPVDGAVIERLPFEAGQGVQYRLGKI